MHPLIQLELEMGLRYNTITRHAYPSSLPLSRPFEQRIAELKRLVKVQEYDMEISSSEQSTGTKQTRDESSTFFFLSFLLTASPSRDGMYTLHSYCSCHSSSLLTLSLFLCFFFFLQPPRAPPSSATLIFFQKVVPPFLSSSSSSFTQHEITCGNKALAPSPWRGSVAGTRGPLSRIWERQQQHVWRLLRGSSSSSLLVSYGPLGPSPVRCPRRCRVTNASILTNIKDMVKDTEDFALYSPTHRRGGGERGGKPQVKKVVVEDLASKNFYAKKRQADAVAYAVKEKDILAEKAKKQLLGQDEEREEEAKIQALIQEAGRVGGPAAAEKMRETIEKNKSQYVRSVEAFGDKSVKLQHSFSGMADNRIIHWYERWYWNYLRYFFTQELLIAKDRFGNKFTVTWQFNKTRGEQRKMYRRDSNKMHLPYGSLSTDDRLWERWLRSHRADPPSVQEEEHYRDYKKTFFGPLVVEDEEVEDTLMRILAHLNRAQSTFQELDEDQVYGDAHRATQPLRTTDRSPGIELDNRQAEKRSREKGATWTMGFVRGDLFYNEEETQVMREELGHLFRNKEWQELEYKRQVRKNKYQPPHGMPNIYGEEKGVGSSRSGGGDERGMTAEELQGRAGGGREVEAIDPNMPDGEPMRQYWERTDLGIPYHDAVPDLTTPTLEKLRIEADQLEDQRLDLRKELGLTDLGGYSRRTRPHRPWGREGPFQPPPVSSRWKPKCWEEPWGTGGGFLN
eukprot:gene7709-5408_t